VGAFLDNTAAGLTASLLAGILLIRYGALFKKN
jgi:hypothetical protein